MHVAIVEPRCELRAIRLVVDFVVLPVFLLTAVLIELLVVIALAAVLVAAVVVALLIIFTGSTVDVIIIVGLTVVVSVDSETLVSKFWSITTLVSSTNSQGRQEGGAGGALSPGPQLLEGPSSKNLD